MSPCLAPGKQEYAPPPWRPSPLRLSPHLKVTEPKWLWCGYTMSLETGHNIRPQRRASLRPHQNSNSLEEQSFIDITDADLESHAIDYTFRC